MTELITRLTSALSVPAQERAAHHVTAVADLWMEDGTDPGPAASNP